MQLVEHLSRAQNTRKMFIDDWLTKHNPEIEREHEIPVLKSGIISQLIAYLKIKNG
ncbi:MAG: hypothetical protein JWN76_1592 [Chitinophagaceae bacterium]|nr:hypothetical protein [Chitinophagaceae bacterium]